MINQFGVVGFADYNIGDVVGQGLDLGIAFAPSETPWAVTLTGNVNNTDFDDITPRLLETIQVNGMPSQPFGFQNGDRYPFVPNFTLAGSVNYTDEIGNTGWKTSNTISLSYRGTQLGNGNIESDPLSLLRVRVGVSRDRYGISVFGNNLLNDRDANYSQRTPALTAFSSSLPRQLGVELNYNF